MFKLSKLPVYVLVGALSPLAAHARNEVQPVASSQHLVAAQNQVPGTHGRATDFANVPIGYNLTYSNVASAGNTSSGIGSLVSHYTIGG